jgi:hypothetical protein
MIAPLLSRRGKHHPKMDQEEKAAILKRPSFVMIILKPTHWGEFVSRPRALAYSR